jgi:hypothetical protein
MIPQRSITRIAAVHLPEEFLNILAFTPLSVHYVEKIFQQVGRPFDLRVCLKGLSYEHLISDIGIFEDLDFSGPIAHSAEHLSQLTIKKDATIDGFLVWLCLDTIEGETLDILAHEHCWLPVYLPLFSPALPVKAREHMRLLCKRTLSRNGNNPDYSIEGQIVHSNGQVNTFAYDMPHEVQTFRHNRFYQKLFPQNKPQQALSSATKILERKIVSFLRQHLPEYMLPARLVVLDEFPHTISGKVDRSALAALAVPPHQSEAPISMPRTHLEEVLVATWSQIFRQRPISIYDNFFELGGHSLQALQLLSAIRSSTQFTVPLRWLYEAPTIAEFAARLSQHTSKYHAGGPPHE